MKIVTVTLLNSELKKSITYNNDIDFKNVQISSLTSVFDEDLHVKMPIKLLHDGKFLSDTTFIHSLGDQNAFYLYALPLSSLGDSQVEVLIDSVSMEAANKWLKENGSISAKDTPLSKAIKAFTVPVVAAPIARAEPPVVWLQFGLMLRLVVSGFVFCYNKEMDMPKKIALGSIAVAIYLIQIGAVWMWAKLLFRYTMRHFFNLDDNNQIIPPTVPVNAVNGAEPLAGANAMAPNNLSLRIQWLINLVASLSREGVVIPKTPGILFDFAAICIAVVGSLFPQWTPTGAPVMQWD